MREIRYCVWQKQSSNQRGGVYQFPRVPNDRAAAAPSSLLAAVAVAAARRLLLLLLLDRSVRKCEGVRRRGEGN